MLPVLDLTHRDRVALAAELDRVFRETGFAAVENHGVPQETIDRAWEDARSFFAGPTTEKARVAMPYAGYPYGYSGLNEEDLERSLAKGLSTKGDWKESFSIGPPGSWDVEGDRRAAPYRDVPTQWPARPTSLRASWIDYYRAMETLGNRLMGLAATALSLPEDHFDAYFADHVSALRALNYPPGDLSPGDIRAGAHTDFGGITILYPEPGSKGLQILRAGDWVDVPTKRGAFVVNIGDLMARWTNDRWVSTMHRVVAPLESRDSSSHEREARQSVAFFYNPSADARIECLSTCLGPGESASYPPVRAGEHLMQKYRRSVDPTE